MSSIVSWFVIFGTLGSIAFFFLLLQMNKRVNRPGETTGHSYDGIEEYDNPMPAWWYWSFILSIVFAIGYLIYYPGLGNFPGLGGWTVIGELEQEQALADEKYGPIFAQYADIPVEELASNPDTAHIGAPAAVLVSLITMNGLQMLFLLFSMPFNDIVENVVQAVVALQQSLFFVMLLMEDDAIADQNFTSNSTKVVTA